MRIGRRQSCRLVRERSVSTRSGVAIERASLLSPTTTAKGARDAVSYELPSTACHQLRQLLLSSARLCTSPTTFAGPSTARRPQQYRERAREPTRHHSHPPQPVLEVSIRRARRHAIMSICCTDETLHEANSSARKRASKRRDDVPGGQLVCCAARRGQRRTFLVMMKEVPIKTEEEMASASPM